MKHPNELDQQLDNLRTLQQSYDAIATGADAYSTGKVQLAENLEFKGVQASASETLPELAAKVRDIAQTTTEIVGGEMYGAQLFGDANPAQSPLWNLYDVLAQMKTRFMGAGQYAALIVCEYYKGYDSLQLQGADAYYTCDGDLYETSMPLHVWHDADNGRANRWVCFLFATAGARLDITNTAISPRSMYIGGHIGTIEYFVNGRLTDLVCGVEETDIVDNFLSAGFTQNFGNNIILRGVKNTKGLDVKSSSGNVIIQGLGDISLPNDNDALLFVQNNRYIEVNTNSIALALGTIISSGDKNRIIAATDIIIHGALSSTFLNYSKVIALGNYSSLQRVVIDGYKGGFRIFFATNDSIVNLIDLEIGEANNNVRAEGWLATNVIADATKKAQLIDNIKNHILAKVSDRTGLSQLVFTVSTNMYNAIASETITWNDQTMTLADAFLTKNWLLAGA